MYSVLYWCIKFSVDVLNCTSLHVTTVSVETKPFITFELTRIFCLPAIQLSLKEAEASKVLWLHVDPTQRRFVVCWSIAVTILNFLLYSFQPKVSSLYPSFSAPAPAPARKVGVLCWRNNCSFSLQRHLNLRYSRMELDYMHVDFNKYHELYPQRSSKLVLIYAD